MQKGYKRDKKGLAVLHFFIGLVFVLLAVATGYFLLSKMDYSDSIKDPSTTQRSYVEITADPSATAAQTGTPAADPTGASVTTAATTAGLVITAPDASSVVDLTTPEVTATPTTKPTAKPTAVPTPTPEPTPEPTNIPKDALSQYKTKGFTIPALSTNGVLELTKFYVSAPDNNSIIQLQGYGYINDLAFDGATATLFPIVTQASSGKQIVYQASMIPGISGEDHAGAVCTNPGNTDFEAFIDVSKYADGDYKLGVVIYYSQSGRNAYSYHEFENGIFTVTGGMITSRPNI